MPPGLVGDDFRISGRDDFRMSDTFTSAYVPSYSRSQSSPSLMPGLKVERNSIRGVAAPLAKQRKFEDPLETKLPSHSPSPSEPPPLRRAAPRSPKIIPTAPTIADFLEAVAPVFDGPEHAQIIQNVSPDVIDALLDRTKGLHSDKDDLFNRFDGWERLHIDYDGETLIVRFPTIIHEHISSIFTLVPLPKGSNDGKFVLRPQGSAKVSLYEGTAKDPDYQFREKPARTSGASPTAAEIDDGGAPTICIEVKYSEEEFKLAHDAGRLILLTQGAVRLVICVVIRRPVWVKGQPRPDITEVYWDFWEPTKLLRPEPVRGVYPPPETTVRPFYEDNTPVLATEHLPVPVADKYTAVMDLDGELFEMECSCVKRHLVYSKIPRPCVSEIKILNRHLHRDPAPDTHNLPAIIIPQSVIQSELEEAIDFQRLSDKREAAQKIRESLAKHIADDADNNTSRKRKLSNDPDSSSKRVNTFRELFQLQAAADS